MFYKYVLIELVEFRPIRLARCQKLFKIGCLVSVFSIYRPTSENRRISQNFSLRYNFIAFIFEVYMLILASCSRILSRSLKFNMALFWLYISVGFTVLVTAEVSTSPEEVITAEIKNTTTQKTIQNVVSDNSPLHKDLLFKTKQPRICPIALYLLCLVGLCRYFKESIIWAFSSDANFRQILFSCIKTLLKSVLSFAFPAYIHVVGGNGTAPDKQVSKTEEKEVEVFNISKNTYTCDSNETSCGQLNNKRKSASKYKVKRQHRRKSPCIIINKGTINIYHADGKTTTVCYKETNVQQEKITSLKLARDDPGKQGSRQEETTENSDSSFQGTIDLTYTNEIQVDDEHDDASITEILSLNYANGNGITSMSTSIGNDKTKQEGIEGVASDLYNAKRVLSRAKQTENSSYTYQNEFLHDECRTVNSSEDDHESVDEISSVSDGTEETQIHRKFRQSVFPMTKDEVDIKESIHNDCLHAETAANDCTTSEGAYQMLEPPFDYNGLRLMHITGVHLDPIQVKCGHTTDSKMKRTVLPSHKEVDECSLILQEDATGKHITDSIKTNTMLTSHTELDEHSFTLQEGSTGICMTDSQIENIVLRSNVEIDEHNTILQNGATRHLIPNNIECQVNGGINHSINDGACYLQTTSLDWLNIPREMKTRHKMLKLHIEPNVMQTRLSCLSLESQDEVDFLPSVEKPYQNRPLMSQKHVTLSSNDITSITSGPQLQHSDCFRNILQILERYFSGGVVLSWTCNPESRLPFMWNTILSRTGRYSCLHNIQFPSSPSDHELSLGRYGQTVLQHGQFVLQHVEKRLEISMGIQHSCDSRLSYNVHKADASSNDTVEESFSTIKCKYIMLLDIHRTRINCLPMKTVCGVTPKNSCQRQGGMLKLNVFIPDSYLSEFVYFLFKFAYHGYDNKRGDNTTSLLPHANNLCHLNLFLNIVKLLLVRYQILHYYVSQRAQRPHIRCINSSNFVDDRIESEEYEPPSRIIVTSVSKYVENTEPGQKMEKSSEPTSTVSVDQKHCATCICLQTTTNVAKVPGLQTPTNVAKVPANIFNEETNTNEDPNIVGLLGDQYTSNDRNAHDETPTKVFESDSERFYTISDSTRLTSSDEINNPFIHDTLSKYKGSQECPKSNSSLPHRHMNQEKKQQIYSSYDGNRIVHIVTENVESSPLHPDSEESSMELHLQEKPDGASFIHCHNCLTLKQENERLLTENARQKQYVQQLRSLQMDNACPTTDLSMDSEDSHGLQLNENALDTFQLTSTESDLFAVQEESIQSSYDFRSTVFAPINNCYDDSNAKNNQPPKFNSDDYRKREHNKTTLEEIQELNAALPLIPDIQNKFKNLTKCTWIKRIVSNGRFVRIKYDAMDQFNAVRFIKEATDMESDQFECIYDAPQI